MKLLPIEHSSTKLPLPDPCLAEPNGDCADCYFRMETVTVTRQINEGHDGLIPISSQRMNGRADGDVYTAQGVNHLEVGNHPRMTEILNDIFDRRDEVFFRD